MYTAQDIEKIDIMYQQQWTYSSYVSVDNNYQTATLSEMVHPLNNQMPYQNAMNNSLASISMNTNQSAPLYWPITHRLPPFHVLKRAIDYNVGRYRNEPKPPLIPSAATLTGQPLIYQPSQINCQQLIARQQAMLYGNGVLLTSAPTFFSTATPKFDGNLLQELPQNPQNTFNTTVDYKHNTDHDLVQQSPTASNSYTGTENSLSVSSASSNKSLLPKKLKGGKVKYLYDGKYLKFRTKRKYRKIFYKRGDPQTSTFERLASTSNYQTTSETNNDNNLLYQFNGSMGSDGHGMKKNTL